MTIDINELRFSAANSVRDLALLPSEVLELIDRLETAEQTAQDYLRIDWEKAQIAQRLEAAEKERDDLLEALKEIMPFTATVSIGCHGEKCREQWCHSCNSEEEAEAAAQKGCDALAKARAAIAQATGEQP